MGIISQRSCVYASTSKHRRGYQDMQQWRMAVFTPAVHRSRRGGLPHMWTALGVHLHKNFHPEWWNKTVCTHVRSIGLEKQMATWELTFKFLWLKKEPLLMWRETGWASSLRKCNTIDPQNSITACLSKWSKQTGLSPYWNLPVPTLFTRYELDAFLYFHLGSIYTFIWDHLRFMARKALSRRVGVWGRKGSVTT